MTSNGRAGMLNLQLALELVPVAPVRAVGKNLVRIRLDHAGFAQPQRVETDRVIGAVLAPLLVGNIPERLERVVITTGEAGTHDLLCGSCRIGSAKVGRLEDFAQYALGRDRMFAHEVRVPRNHAAKILRPRA